MKISKEGIIEEFLSESNKIEQEFSDEALEDAKKAWDYAYENRKNITVDYILEIHRLLMQRLEPGIAGKVRDCAVYIGYHCKEKKPEKVLLQELQDWIDSCKSDDKITEKDVKKSHVDFEFWHGFQDGNGRTGRILWQIQRIMNGLPVKIIHTGREQQKYYEWFR